MINNPLVVTSCHNVPDPGVESIGPAELGDLTVCHPSFIELLVVLFAVAMPRKLPWLITDSWLL